MLTEQSDEIFDTPSISFPFTLKYEYINNIEECYKELFPDKWEELIEDYICNEWEGYSRDCIINKICNSRDELINIESSF